MQLTLFSDYALRVLLYLALHPDRLVPVDEIALSYRISRHHLLKVTQQLAKLKLIETTRGRGGGVRLLRRPEEIGIGALLRDTEPHLDLVECFDPKTNTCPIAPACGLKGALLDARRAFFGALDHYTLADFSSRKPKLTALWEAARDQG